MPKFSTNHLYQISAALMSNPSLNFFLTRLEMSGKTISSWITYSHPDDTGRSSLEITWRDDESYRLEIVLEEDHALTTRDVFVRTTWAFEDVVRLLQNLTAFDISDDKYAPESDLTHKLNAL